MPLSPTRDESITFEDCRFISNLFSINFLMVSSQDFYRIPIHLLKNKPVFLLIRQDQSVSILDGSILDFPKCLEIFMFRQFIHAVAIFLPLMDVQSLLMKADVRSWKSLTFRIKDECGRKEWRIKEVWEKEIYLFAGRTGRGEWIKMFQGNCGIQKC